MPPCTFGSAWVMSPTLSAAPVAGMSCMMPIAPTWLRAFWSRRDSW